MRKVIDYRVIDGYNVKAFQTEVLEALSEGYVPAGGVALSPMLRDMVSRGQAYDLIKQHFGVEE